MKAACVILMCLLICGSAYGREHKRSALSAKVLRAASTASETEGTETDDQETGDTDDQEMNNDTDTDDNDNGTTTGTEGSENDDATKNDDNETDDMDDGTSTVPTAVRNALKVSALQRSEKPFAATTASLNASLDASKAIAQMLEPADLGHSAVASATILQAMGGGSAAAKTGALMVSDNAAIALSSSSSSGKLSVTTVPEPTSFLMLAMGGVPWFWIRRRPCRYPTR
jgi:hypothetical protein